MEIGLSRLLWAAPQWVGAFLLNAMRMHQSQAEGILEMVHPRHRVRPLRRDTYLAPPPPFAISTCAKIEKPAQALSGNLASMTMRAREIMQVFEPPAGEQRGSDPLPRLQALGRHGGGHTPHHRPGATAFRGGAPVPFGCLQRCTTGVGVHPCGRCHSCGEGHTRPRRWVLHSIHHLQWIAAKDIPPPPNTASSPSPSAGRDSAFLAATMCIASWYSFLPLNCVAGCGCGW